MWSKISSALKPREGNDGDLDHLDAQSTARHPPPDPFCANATTYYTQQTPPTPPPGVHSRTASREEDIIWSLRTQLALQQEMCAQFDIDLGARDELVEALTIRLDASEKENDRRKSVVRSWKKKAADLEKMCRHLEEEVDNSRRESVERSIMDEASGEALRQLHRKLSQLERERNDLEAERNSLAQTVENTETEFTRLKEKSAIAEEASGEAIRQLHHHLSQLERERNDLEAERNTLSREKGDVETERDNFSSEISRLRIQIQQLQKDSAVMEVTIVQLNKQLDQDKEDINGLNIALESKQQELELVKRKHPSRGTVGPTAGRTGAPPSTAGRPVVSAGPPSKISRTSTVGARTSPPIPLRVPSTLGRAANTKLPITSALRRASISSVESKTKFPNRRVSIAFTPSEVDEKENTSIPVPLKNPRRTMDPT
ncbi:hypothetical protein J3R82DRAFT_8887 [Butyriboletus roseoflavus]|nr:hypothetical protein J3R82DRAFT_8887 [Butyriboletus roseoflavus]